MSIYNHSYDAKFPISPHFSPVFFYNDCFSLTDFQQTETKFEIGGWGTLKSSKKGVTEQCHVKSYQPQVKLDSPVENIEKVTA